MRKGYISTYTNYKRSELTTSGIYTITNTINNKIYVGSSVNFYDRWRIHIGDLILKKHTNSYLQRSVEKYGLENFKFEILEECDLVFLRDLETYWINTLRTCESNFGYNINSNTTTRLGAVLSQETKDKIIKSLTGRKIPEEQRLKNAFAIREVIAKSIVVLDLSGKFVREYKCISDAAREFDIDPTNVVANLKGKSKTAANHVFVYKAEYDPEKDYSRTKGKDRKRVMQYDKDMNYIATFENSTKAAESVKGDPRNINTICIGYGRNKSYKGYIWKYEQ